MTVHPVVGVCVLVIAGEAGAFFADGRIVMGVAAVAYLVLLLAVQLLMRSDFERIRDRGETR